MVHGIIKKQVAGNLVIATEVRASRDGICRYESQPDIVEWKQGKVIIEDAALKDGDWVATIWTVTNKTTGEVTRAKTDVLFPAGVRVVEDCTITLPSGTVIDKDQGVRVD